MGSAAAVGFVVGVATEEVGCEGVQPGTRGKRVRRVMAVQEIDRVMGGVSGWFGLSGRISCGKER
jgi:hypothetical protein